MKELNGTMRILSALFIFALFVPTHERASAQTPQGSAEQDAVEVRVYPLENVPSRLALRVLASFIDGREGVRMEQNESNNSVIVAATPQHHERVSKVIENLDVRQTPDVVQNRLVRVTWIVDAASVDERFRESLDPIPLSLAGLKRAFAETKTMADPKVITSVSTVVRPSNPDEKSNPFKNGSKRLIDDAYFGIETNGHLSQTGDSQFSLDLSLELTHDDISVSMNTTVALPENHPVAFTISSVGEIRSAAVAEVLTSK